MGRRFRHLSLVVYTILVAFIHSGLPDSVVFSDLMWQCNSSLKPPLYFPCPQEKLCVASMDDGASSSKHSHFSNVLFQVVVIEQKLKSKEFLHKHPRRGDQRQLHLHRKLTSVKSVFQFFKTFCTCQIYLGRNIV